MCDSLGSSGVRDLKRAWEDVSQEDLIITTSEFLELIFLLSLKAALQGVQGVPEVSQPHLVSILGNPTCPALIMGLVTEEAGQKLSMWVLHSCIPQLTGCQLTPAPGLKGGQSAEAPVPEVTICPAAYPSLQQRDWVSEEQYTTTTWDITWDISLSRPRHAF